MLGNTQPTTTAQAADHAPRRPPVLRTQNLKRSFGKVEAVRGVNLTVEEGQIYGFLGRNGAGKTSTIRMIMGIIKPDEGKIDLLGESTQRTSITQKQQIGYVSQGQHFYPWMTCRALGKFVSGFYPNWDKQEFTRLLKVLELPPDRRSSHLSGGMKVKLALALALAHRPALLILDEPTAGLDAVARREFLDIIQNQTRDHGRTTFFSTHRIDEVERVADRVGIILKGKMRYEGSLSNLTNSVRKVRLTLPEQLAGDALSHPYTETNGFELLSQKTVDGQQQLITFAQASSWTRQETFPDAQIEALSLEDVFIACAGDDVKDI